ncbi:amino acid ABC transporter permease [Streptomyces sp. WAC05374]|uniref:amino acid ABC transporter permease n=1 Tax=Streptomyces sp. WAC05374 TaxID=2487420 RepID=UPI000F85E862|nr:amino acid ABC transporter permease [Streptomyces sp. WAC05374]RST18196.1 amino acid ABC transporter permease [Streptomyces sp. WAC05374]TDF43745.1 amino acid ABC transporter permease [Streptomyces sp. WAC05374]TDF52087.1 amino acid ABC transporter permease [Streptomyces sp. WAC05374]TDF54442.1 amino acid ABC transporter permease [Streptomyces sp. WAC05374]
MSASVLFDAPGPKAVIRNRIYAVIGTLAIVGLLAVTIVRLGDKGHLAPEMWDIFNYAGIRQNIADALLATLKAFGIAAVGSLVLGVLLAVARLSDHKPVRWLATGFIELFRSIPLLITIYAVWVGFLTDYSMWALAVGLSIYNGCVQAEVLRAGINSVPKGQREAAYALGMSKTQVMTTVLMPQAVRAMLPTIISQLVVTLKDTSLGFIILYPELLQTARLIASNTQVNGMYPYVSTIVVIGAIYVAMCLALSALATWVEKRGRRAKTGIQTPDAAGTVAVLAGDAGNAAGTTAIGGPGADGGAGGPANN